MGSITEGLGELHLKLGRMSKIKPRLDHRTWTAWAHLPTVFLRDFYLAFRSQKEWHRFGHKYGEGVRMNIESKMLLVVRAGILLAQKWDVDIVTSRKRLIDKESSDSRVNERDQYQEKANKGISK